MVEQYGTRTTLQAESLGVVGKILAFPSGHPGSIPAGSGIFISILGLGVHPLSVSCPVFSLA